MFLLRVLGSCFPGISGVPHGHRLRPLLAERSSFYLISSSTFFFGARSFMSHQRSQLSLAWRIIISSAPLSRARRSASPAAQRRAVPHGDVPFRVLPCGTVLCGAVPCFAVLRAFCCTFTTCRVSFEVSYHRFCCCTYVPSTILLNHKITALAAQLSPSIAQ